MAFTYYLRNLILDYVFGKQAFAQLITLYIGLCTGCDENGVVLGEPTIGDHGYARIAVTNNDTNFPNAVNGMKSNDVIQSFAEATDSWGMLTYAIISDAATDGNILCYEELVAQKDVGNGDIVSFQVGDLAIAMAG